MSTISACIITDGKDDLKKCLESIKSSVDEIIVVDTENLKKTKKIVSNYSDKFFKYKWKNDFAAARNFSIRKAKKDLIFWIDSDEYLCGSIPKNLRKDQFYSIRRYNIDKNNKVLCKEKLLRIFPNSKNFKFIGKVHEYLVDKNKKRITKSKVISRCILYHRGYESTEKNLKKLNRNFKILQKEIKNKRNLKANYFFLTRYYYNKARYIILKQKKISKTAENLLQKAIDAYKKYTSLPGKDGNKKDAQRINDLSVSALLFKNKKIF